MTETQITRQDEKAPVPAIPAALTLADIKSIGAIFIKSGFFQDTRDEAQAIVKILAGQELGFGPFASMNNIHIIKGKVAYAAVLIAAAIKKSGRYDFRVVTHTNTECSLAFSERIDRKWEWIGDSTFTIEDAKKAGLGGQNYNAYPRNMLFARALTNGARWHCANVFSGAIYTPDELGAEVDAETGEVISKPQESEARDFRKAMARGRRAQEVITGPSTPAETFPSDEQADKESRELFPNEEEQNERAALNAEIQRLWMRLKTKQDERQAQLKEYLHGGTLLTADIAAMTDYVNYLRSRCSPIEPKWGQA